TTAKIVNYWQGQSTFVTGLTQETCRDFTHTGHGVRSGRGGRDGTPCTRRHARADGGVRP
ncbi:hypothetical protein, partial [Streptomyces sp. NPDC005568]|uniref:hypothetical protein n=1 Tax=Streptomyces sp. NPDC005568 TaxID=3156887 RepID=UPI0033AB9695